MFKEAGFREVRGTYANLPAFPIALALALLDRSGLSPCPKSESVKRVETAAAMGQCTGARGARG